MPLLRNQINAVHVRFEACPITSIAPTHSSVTVKHTSMRPTIEDVPDADEFPIFNSMDFDAEGPLLIQIPQANKAAAYMSSTSPSQPGSDPLDLLSPGVPWSTARSYVSSSQLSSPPLNTESTASGAWDFHFDEQTNEYDGDGKEGDSEDEDDGAESEHSETSNEENEGDADESEADSNRSWESRSPPSIQSAKDALADLNAMLKPPRAKGGGYKEC